MEMERPVIRVLSRPVFFCNPVVLESFCYRTREKQLINESNTTGGLKKIWTGCILTLYTAVRTCVIVKVQVFKKWTPTVKNECVPNLFSYARPIFFSVLQVYCSRSSVILLSYDSRLTLIRQHGWEKLGRAPGCHAIFSPNLWLCVKEKKFI